MKNILKLCLNPRMQAFRKQFIEESIVDITECFEKNELQRISHETIRLFDEVNERRDFIQSFTDNTPRHLANVKKSIIDQHSSILTSFYFSEEILALIEEIAMEKVNIIPFADDRYMINGLVQKNDTHGWHWDDYAYALIVIVEAPPKTDGGILECIPHTYWNKECPNISQTVLENIVNTYWFPAGSVYLMRSDTTLHRVTEIRGSQRRLVFVTGYSNEADQRKIHDHQTVFDLQNLR